MLAAVGYGWFQWQCWGVQVTCTQVPVANLPAAFAGLRIVHLSDLHGHIYGENSQRLLNLVAQQQPEVIVITGDLIDQESQLEMVPALALAGVDDPNGYAGQKTAQELRQEIEREVGPVCTLLLAHRNDRFDQYAAAGYDLVLSGHGHGGIVRLPFTDGLLGTNRKFFPTWTSGVYTLGESTLFVSRGLGNNTVPISGFRLFNRPELAVLELTEHNP